MRDRAQIGVDRLELEVGHAVKRRPWHRLQHSLRSAGRPERANRIAIGSRSYLCFLASHVLAKPHHPEEFGFGEAQRTAARIRGDIARHEAAEAPAAGEIVPDVEISLQLPAQPLVLWLP